MKNTRLRRPHRAFQLLAIATLLAMLCACAHSTTAMPADNPTPGPAHQTAAPPPPADTPARVTTPQVPAEALSGTGRSQTPLTGAAADQAPASGTLATPAAVPRAAAPVTASAPAAPAGQSTADPATGHVTLNFDDADIYEVIRTMAALLRINYIVDPNVRGRVTIQTAGTIRPDELFAVFFQILEANGLTAVKDGPVYRITTLKEAARLPLAAQLGASPSAMAPGERVVMQILPLKNIKSAEMAKLLAPFVSAEGTILADAESNTLLLVDRGTNILKALKLVEAFDIDVFEGVSYRFFKIKNMYVKDIIPILNDVFTAYPGGFRSEVKLIPIERLNMLLVMSQQPRVFEKVIEMLETLDKPGDGNQAQIFVYSVKNGEAGDLAGLLERIFSSSTTPAPTAPLSAAQPPGTPTPRSQENPFIRTTETRTAEKSTPAGPLSADAPAGTLRGAIRIIPDSTRNLLIIEALPSDWHIIQAVLERLDILTRQVLIEAMIAEITLDDSTALGLEWASREGQRAGTTLLAGASGLNYIVGLSDRWTVTLNALATENRVNILSSPSVLASNEKEARIDISTEVPVASASFRYGGTTEGSVVQTTVEYRNTGIILNVTPYINENGMVTMDISQEVSEQAGDVTVGDQTYPSFFKRSVKTNLTVGHNQTIVIGGLIRENQSHSVSGVPFFTKIPIIGYLFGRNTITNNKTELIVLITPRVIVNLGDVDAVTEDFSNKVRRIRQPSRM